MLLIALVVVPLAFAGAIALLPAERARHTAFIGTLVAAAVGVLAVFTFNWSAPESISFPWGINWLPGLGVQLSVGADSVSFLLILLTLLFGPICVAASATAITERVKTYYAWLLVLQAAMTGVFAARDLIFFYVCFEFTLLPMYILISLWGSTNRKKAATRFFLYTFTGSVITLAGLGYVAFKAFQASPTGEWTFEIDRLQTVASGLPASAQAMVLLALMAGFAVKVPLFPLHTWLPLAHTEAPTAGSVILAGVLLKLGTYGIYRFALPFVPEAMIEYAPFIAALCLVGILYGGLICWVQTDVKKLIAYSSVAHLGFCILGLVALNTTGITGSILYMINHGLSTGALFLLVGMIYERYHTRDMAQLGGLAAKMPIWSTYMVFFVMASVGLPGLNGFVSEFLCLLGAFQADSGWGRGAWRSSVAMPGGTNGVLGPWYAAIAAIGMIIAAIYLLYMVGKVVFGPLIEPHGHGHEEHGDAHAALPHDLNTREIALLAPLAILCLVLGLYPQPVIKALSGPVNMTVSQYKNDLAAAAEKAHPAPGTPEAEPKDDPAPDTGHSDEPSTGGAH